MKNTTYVCNTCNKTLKLKSAQCTTPFIGVEFDMSNKLIVRSYWDVDLHFCFKCLRQLHDLYEKYKNEESTFNMDPF